jgi:uncharacterized membrane protein
MTELVKQPSYAPTRKMAATGIGGVISVAVLAGLNAWIPGLGDILSEPVYALVAVAGAWLSGYMVKEAKA